MTTRAEHYLQKAEQFEAMARSTRTGAAKAVYEHLAWSYRQLGIHVSRTSRGEPGLEGLPDRMVGGNQS
jgi:hypothetical protein